MFDLEKLLEQTAGKIAEVKGYGSVTDLITGTAAKNIARITDKPNEVKQTPPVVAPTPYVMEVLGEKSILGLTNAQLAMIGGLGVIVLVLALKKGRR